MKNEIYGFVRECNMPVNDIVPMKESPFKVRNDKNMKNLVESIRQFGVLEPLTVRKTVTALREEKYEIVSGNRRYEACKQLGIRYIPVRVVEMMKDAAIIAMIDSNLCHRESILPSEKAAAYKMRLEAMKRQGYRTDLDEALTSDQVGQKLETSLSAVCTAREGRHTLSFAAEYEDSNYSSFSEQDELLIMSEFFGVPTEKIVERDREVLSELKECILPQSSPAANYGKEKNTALQK